MTDDKEIDENRIVCLCKRVSYKTIKEAVLSGVTRIEFIRAKTKANTGCATHCTEEVLRIIEKYKK